MGRYEKLEQTKICKAKALGSAAIDMAQLDQEQPQLKEIFTGACPSPRLGIA